MKLVLDDTLFFRRVHILTFNFHCIILTHEIGKLKKSKQSIGFSTMIDVADITSCSQCTCCAVCQTYAGTYKQSHGS